MGVLKSLESCDFVILSDIPNTAYTLTSEGASYVEANASPEAQVFKAVADAHAAGTPATVASLKEGLGSVADIGFKQAMQQKWVMVDKSGGAPVMVPKVDMVEDTALHMLKAVEAGKELDSKSAAALAKRKLVSAKKWSTWRVEKGPRENNREESILLYSGLVTWASGWR